MHNLILLSTGAAFAFAMGGLLRYWQRHQAAQRRSEALAVLKKHGLSPQLYLTTLGVTDAELRCALDEFAFSGHLIVNAQQEVIGTICQRAEMRPRLRLVISNN